MRSDDRRKLGPRAIAFLLALALEGLGIVALLLSAAQKVERPKPEPRPVSFQMLPEGKKAAARSPDKKQVIKSSDSARAAPPTPLPPVAPPPLPNVPVPAPYKLIQISPEQFAETDLARLRSKQDQGGASADNGKSRGSSAAYGPGEGPGGQTLYNAEWYREPTHAELVTYLPPGLRAGSALIACQTVEKYHVENCGSLGEDPPGSGLARALRLASWQFLVRPPRIDGKPIIGAWVRIRFDLSEGVAK